MTARTPMPFAEPSPFFPTVARDRSDGRTDPALLAGLRAQIARLSGGGDTAADALLLGAAAIDATLPGGGLPRACLHEIIAGDGSAAAAGFAAVLLARLAADGGTVVWCRRRGGGASTARLYAPALPAFGLASDRLLVVHVGPGNALPWAMEECLRSGAVAGVLGEAGALAPIVLRRLQLAAETGRTTALLLRPCSGGSAGGGVTSRWRVTAAPSATVPPTVTSAMAATSPQRSGWSRWRVDLEWCRAAMPAGWLVDWCDATHRLVVVSPLSDRSAAPALPVDGDGGGRSVAAG